MANVTTFSASEVMREISKLAPFAILICALLSFVAVGIFSVDYYNELFSERFKENSHQMAVMVAVIQEAVRFGLLIASIRDFTDNKKFNGWLGLVASVILVWHDMALAKDIAVMWSNKHSEHYYSVLVFLILIGLVLEIRLILTVGNTSQILGKQRQNQLAKKHSQNGVHHPV